MTMINSHESSEVRVSAGQKTYRRKPRQIFWNRRLTRNRTIEMSKGDSKNSQSSSLCDNNNSTASLESKLSKLNFKLSFFVARINCIQQMRWVSDQLCGSKLASPPRILIITKNRATNLLSIMKPLSNSLLDMKT